MQVEASSRAVRVRRRQTSGVRMLARWTLIAAVVVAVSVGAVALAFAGSPSELATGVRIAGLDVGGLSAEEARRVLETRARELATVPVVVTAEGRRWRLRPNRLGVEPDWAAAVAAAQVQGGGAWPLRGLRRMRLRLFGSEVSPPTEVWKRVLDYRLAAIARAIDHPHRDATLARRGLRIVVVPGQEGVVLDRERAGAVAVEALSSLEREGAVALPIRTDPQRVTTGELDEAAAQARTAISRSVRLALGPTRWRIPRWRIAKLLALPSGGETELKIGGAEADRFFGRLARRIDRPARDADFAISSSNSVSVVPAREGLALDRSQSSKRLLVAALSPRNRVARLVVATQAPKRTTGEARAMGITGLVGAYETIYGGEPNRLHNVRLVAQLIDRTLIAPGAQFSFNRTTGERTPERGFREAPVIINGELQTGIGGGVCQVSTTVFNAAYEAGLGITARTNHALYISHYPQGRDATVNYPDLDLRFVNDTGRWLLLRTFVGSSSLTVALYGRPTDRRVDSETEPLAVTGSIPVKRVADPNLYEGETVTEEYGQPPRRTSVQRLVYAPSGRLLHEDTWYSSYSAEPTVVRYGTKPRPAPPPPPEEKPEKTEKKSQEEETSPSGPQAGTETTTTTQP